MAKITLGAGPTDATVADYPPPAESDPPGTDESTTQEVEVSEPTPEPVEPVEVPAQEVEEPEAVDEPVDEAAAPEAPAAEPEA